MTDKRDDDLVPLETTRLAVAQPGYPSEVTCRKCLHLMLPDDLEGSSWTCYVCSRRILIVLSEPPT